jgi:membrane protein implicated in regulation of membrane protease activity
MDFVPMDWHWMVFGMLLMITELFVPVLVGFWFGLGAVIVAIALFVVPGISLSIQLFIWVVFSLSLLGLWMLFFKRFMPDRTRAGISRKATIGTVGQVLAAPMAGESGKVRFTTPLLGASEWPIISGDNLSEGDRVWVVDVSGNTLVVSLKPPQFDSSEEVTR